ncbi:MAG: hypothetical protein K2W96_18415 [Gemmataceae bacterium]|nr:hypothetical protein [Gemmataceae bacterium]
MSLDFRKVAIATILADGKVDEVEAKVLGKALKDEEGRFGGDAARFLVELRTAAQKKKAEVTEGFEKFFFKALEDFVLKDGNISRREVAWLETHLLADGKIDDREWKFLQAINKKATKKHADFDAMYARLEAKHGAK